MLVWERDCHLCFKNGGEPIQKILPMWDWSERNSEKLWLFIILCFNWRFCVSIQRKKEQHLFKWVDEALLDEIQMMHEQQSRMAKEIEDLRRSLKMTVEEAVIEHKKSGDVGLIGSILTFLCLCSKFDWSFNCFLNLFTLWKIESIWYSVLSIYGSNLNGRLKTCIKLSKYWKRAQYIKHNWSWKNRVWHETKLMLEKTLKSNLHRPNRL